MKRISGINSVKGLIWKDNMAEEVKEQETGNYDELNQEPIDTPIEGVDEDDLKNYAGQMEIEDSIREILENVDLARDTRRAKVEDDWERYRDIYNCRRTQAYYNGRSKLFLGAAKKAVDTLTRIAREAILSDPYLTVETDIPQWQTTGVQFIKDQVERQGKIKQVVPIFLRQLYQLGTSCIKLGFKKECRQVKYRERGSGEVLTRKVFTHYGPEYTVIDMKKVYVWPETATDFSGLQIIFEDATITADKLRRLADDGIYNKERAEQAIANHEETQKIQQASNSQASKEMGKELHNDQELDISYIWAQFQLPDQEEPQWNLITVSGD